MADKLKAAEFAKLVKQKYPDYANVPDADLVRMIVTKHPEYAERVDIPSLNELTAGQQKQNVNRMGDVEERAHDTANGNVPRDYVSNGSAIGRATNSFGHAIGLPTQWSDYATGPAHAIAHPIDSAGLLAGGYNDAIAQGGQTALERMAKPGWRNKVAGAEEYGLSAIPLIGPNLAHATEEGAQGNLPGEIGTLGGTVAPAVVPEGIGAVRKIGGEVPSIGRIGSTSRGFKFSGANNTPPVDTSFDTVNPSILNRDTSFDAGIKPSATGSIEGALGTKPISNTGSVEGTIGQINPRNASIARVARANAARGAAHGANEYQVGAINHLADTVEGMPGNLEIGEQLRGVKGVGEGGIGRITDILGDIEKRPTIDPLAANFVGRAERSLASKPIKTIDEPIENPVQPQSYGETPETTAPDDIESQLRKSLDIVRKVKGNQPPRVVPISGADIDAMLDSTPTFTPEEYQQIYGITKNPITWRPPAK